MANKLEIRWIDDGVNFQSVIYKASTTDNGATWSIPVKVYDSTINPPAGFPVGELVLDVSAGTPVQQGYALDIVGPSGGQNQWVYLPSDAATIPTIVDGTNRPSTISGFCTVGSGPWVVGGVLWLLGISPVLHATTVYKSTDGGATWTLMDSANAISATNISGWFWDEVGTKIQFLVATGGSLMALQEFNTATGLYTTVHDTNVSGPNDWGNGFVLVSGTTIFAIYNRTPAGHRQCYASIFSGGSWTTAGPLYISDDVSGNPISSQDVFNCTCGVDAAGRAHLFYGYVGVASAPTMFYRNLSSVAALSTPFAFPAGTGNGDLTGAPNDAIQIPYFDTGGNTIVLPTRGFNPTNGGLDPLIFKGTPIANPTWTGPFPVWDNLMSEYYAGRIALESAISIACPSDSATIGTPYDSFFVVTGGTAPLTFVVLSGGFPTGLSFNTTTGELSGTPTVAGTFTAVVKVTDSNGLTATSTGCPIHVPGGGGSGVPPPCGGSITPQPLTDVQFELRRVYCTMRPHTRIPVRGG